MKLLIGTLTRIGGAGVGMVEIENDTLKLLWSDSSLKDPNWLHPGPNGRWFAVSSNGEDTSVPGCVHELEISREGMRVISTQPSAGAGPCHMAFSDDGRFLLLAQYGTGSVAVFPVLERGLGERIQLAQHTGRGTHPTRQTAAHVHQVTRIPTLPRCFCAVDLGIDALVVYEQAEDGLLSERYRIAVPAGQGPRHVAYTADGAAYLVTEMGCRVYPVIFGETEGRVVGEGVTTLEDEASDSTGSALWVAPNEKSIVASNRGEGSLVAFALPGLEKQSVIKLPAALPRDFCMMDERYTLAACQDFGLVLLKDGQTIDTLPYMGAVRACVFD